MIRLTPQLFEEVFGLALTRHAGGCWTYDPTDTLGLVELPDGLLVRLNRLAFAVYHGPVEGLQVTRSCRNPQCVAPEHLVGRPGRVTKTRVPVEMGGLPRLLKRDLEGEADARRRVGFGMYVGSRVEEVPTAYLEWCVDNLQRKLGEKSMALLKRELATRRASAGDGADLLRELREAGGGAALLGGELVVFVDPSRTGLRERADANRPALLAALRGRPSPAPDDFEEPDRGAAE